ncbi:hypothetical protein [Psychrobacillus psychrodurans]|uniref:Membrane protein involved in the export of O-antigen and teichoic acid n=1 Tax=Psychrobacillus psychrodurans TaxID=126157 RepID=A0A9X3L615_9BACI|nr:hypothetical protein [Psychrobacillus psychrodurans]MCZ8532016.1 hypothetical protein [Psychrobacillus psychrodurans]
MVSTNLKAFLKNISYTLVVNVISLLISLLTVLTLPKIMGVQEYSYWQLYLFYTTYIVFISIGWVDGVYLRYGGFKYDDLPKTILTSQFWSMVLYLLTIFSVLSLGVLYSSVDENKKFVLLATCVSGLIYICRVYLQYVLQSTNKIVEYAKILLIDRISFCTMIVLILILGEIGFKGLVIIDLLIKLITLIYAMFKCSDIIFGKLASIKETIKEILVNISVGIKLTIANFVGIFIIGIVRLGIEQNWDIETFGKVSFTLTVNNMVLGFINAIGLVIFPILCRMPSQFLSGIYINTRTVLIVPLLGILSIYYPLNIILSEWLPEYSMALHYMVLLFPIIIFESKMSLIITPYLNAMRKERILLMVNIIGVALSLIISFFSMFVLESLTIAIVSITFLLAFRCILAELYLANFLKINIKKDILLEVLICLIFIVCNWYITSLFSMVVYLIVYLLYIAFNKKRILDSINAVKKILKRSSTLQ